jgi:homoserine O-succinyltransferase/O-acetyltransferase
MPVSLDPNFFDSRKSVRTNLLRDKPPSEFQERSRNRITIGLINNMPDGALEATERQFISLLDSASEGIQVQLSFHALPNVPRNEFGARHIRDFYSSVDSLFDKRLDGLIVTGREPLTSNLREEPYWQSFTKVLEWAEDNTYSTVWSCLAAHAAILHMDGIGRIKSNDKHCGVFECTRQSDHPLTANAPSSFRLPHSRWNGISEDALTSCGYSVLTRSADVGVDTFAKQHKSLFVFFQGHPEYESNTLLLEYRRDVGRYLRGETNTYPLMPQSYFDDATVLALKALHNRSMSGAREGLLAELSNTLEMSRVENTWHSTAACIYRNWLKHISAQKQLRPHHTKRAVPAHEVDSLAPILATSGTTSSSYPEPKARLPARSIL